MKYQCIIISILCLLNSGCSTSPSSNKGTSKNHSTKNSLPKVPAKQLPGGNGDNWRYLGTSAELAISVEINEASIIHNAELYTFAERKTIVNPQKFNYPDLAQRYKYSISWWKLNCGKHQYQISSNATYNELGVILTQYTFPSDITPSLIVAGSIADMEYQYLCNGLKRNLGY